MTKFRPAFTAIGFERVLTTKEPSLITMLDIVVDADREISVEKVQDYHGCRPCR